MVRAFVLVLVAIVAWAPSASAADQAALNDAKQHYDRGMEHYDLGEYAAAVDEFKLAYALSKAPGLLFNLGQASRLGKQYEQALHFYRAYLRERPDAPNRADVERRIAELEPLVAAERQDELSRMTTPPRPPPPAPMAPAPPTETRRAAAPPRPSGRPLRVAGLVVGALGVAALAGGVGLGVAALDAQNKLSRVATDMGTWTPAEQSLYARGKTEAAAATGLYVAGGVAAATGVVLYVAGWRRDRARFAVAPTPGGAALVWSCAF